MARRKRLNTPVVVLLAAAGVVAVVIGITVYISTLPIDPGPALARGDAAMEQEDYLAAEEAYWEAVRADKERAETFFKLAGLYVKWMDSPELNLSQRRDKFGSALEMLRTALRLKPAYTEAQALLCELYWQRVEGARRAGIESPWKAFLEVADRQIRLSPKDHKTLFRRGRAHAALFESLRGDWGDKALNDFKQAIKLAPSEVDYRVALARFYQQLKQHNEAERVFVEAIESNPSSAELRVQYAVFLRGQDRIEDARRQYDKAIEVEPENVLGRLGLADFYIGERKFDEALKLLREAKELDKADPRAYLTMARVFSVQRRLDKAEEVLREGLLALVASGEETSQTQPDPERRRQRQNAEVTLNYHLANTLLDRAGTDRDNADKLVEEARRCLERLSHINPDAPWRTKIAGRIALATGEYSEATSLLEKANMGFGGTEWQTAMTLANLYLRQNLPGKAAEVLDRLRRSPRFAASPDLLVARARVAIMSQEYGVAARAAQMLLDVDPENEEARALKAAFDVRNERAARLPEGVKLTMYAIRVLLDRVQTLYLDERYDDAIALLKDIHRADPANLSVIIQLAGTYAVRGQKEEAKAVLVQALKDNPDKEVLKRQLEIIDLPRDRQYERIIQLTDVNPDLTPVDRLLEKAAYARRFGKDAEYVKYLQKAAEIAPNSPRVVNRLFQYAVSRKDWKLAKEWEKRAIETNLDRVGGKVYSGQLAMAQGRYEEAIRDFLEALERRPELKSVQVMLGNCYMQLKQYDHAEEAFLSAYNDDHGYVAAVIAMAQLTELTRKTQDHRDWILRAYKLAPQNAYVEAEYIDLMEDRVDPNEAIRKRERIKRRNPANIANRLRLAVLYERQNRLKKAADEFKAVYESIPHKDVDRKLAAAAALAAHYERVGGGNPIGILMELLENTPDKVGAYILIGDHHLSRNEHEQAINAFKAAIEEDKSRPDGYRALAMGYAQGGRWADAAEAMENYMALRPEDRAGQEQLINYLIEAGRFPDAEQQVDRLLAAQPTDARALTLKGKLHLYRGDVSKALEVLTRAAEADREFAQPLVSRARVYIARGEPELAVTDLEDAKKLSPHPRIRMELAKVLRYLRRYADAERAYKEIIEANKDYEPAYRGLAEVYFAQKNYNALEKLLEQAKKRFPRQTVYRNYEAGMWKARGRPDKQVAALLRAYLDAPHQKETVRAYLLGLVETGQFDRALSDSQKHMTDDASKGWVGAIRASALTKLDRAPEAEREFRAALESARPEDVLFVVRQIREVFGLTEGITKLKGWLDTRPKDWRLRIYLFHLYREAKQYNEALDIARRALGMADTDLAKAEVKSSIGLAHYYLRDLAKAEESYLSSLQDNPNHLQSLNNLAYLYVEEQDDPAKALPFIEKAARVAPGNADVLDTHGWTLLKLKRYDEARRYLVRAIQISQPSAAFRYHLGRLYEETNHLDDAERQFREGFKLVRSDPSARYHDELKEALERVRKKGTQP